MTRDERIREREALLAALAEGLTDEAAGRRLGWSRRKLRRVLGEALADLGAGSRFQAGYLFARVFCAARRDGAGGGPSYAGEGS